MNNSINRFWGVLLGSALALPAYAGTEVDVEKSTFAWTGTKKVGSKHFGKIQLKSADVTVKNGKIQSGEFVMNMNSITVEDLEGEWRDKLLGHLKSGDFFEVEKYPVAKLVIEKQVDKDTVRGKLTIKGKTQPISVDFKPAGKNQYKGTLTFDRTKFGIVYGAKSFFKSLVADKIINDKVTVDFVVATRSS